MAKIKKRLIEYGKENEHGDVFMPGCFKQVTHIAGIPIKQKKRKSNPIIILYWFVVFLLSSCIVFSVIAFFIILFNYLSK